MSWNPSTDNETADNALTYNVYIKRDDGSFYWSPNTIDSTGWMLQPDWGNVGQASSWTVYDMETAYYSFSVQAVDQGLMSSEFAPELHFSVGNVGLENLESSNEISVSPNPATTHISLNTSGDCSVCVRDMHANIVWETYHYLPQSKIDVSTLKSGVYFVEVVDSKAVKSLKLVIER